MLSWDEPRDKRNLIGIPWSRILWLKRISNRRKQSSTLSSWTGLYSHLFFDKVQIARNLGIDVGATCGAFAISSRNNTDQLILVDQWATAVAVARPVTQSALGANVKTRDGFAQNCLVIPVALILRDDAESVLLQYTRGWSTSYARTETRGGDFRSNGKFCSCRRQSDNLDGERLGHSSF